MAAMLQMLSVGRARKIATITISADTQNYTLNTAKVTGYEAGNTDATLVINSGVYVGSSSTGTYSLTVASGWDAKDRLYITNNGNILGAGGAGAGGNTVGAGGAGGPAMQVLSNVTITNAGVVGGGGGGGGAGANTSSTTKFGTTYYAGGAGGGGQGYSAGSPNGSTTAAGGGAGGASGYSGGNGGTLGVAGGAGAAGGGGGAAGACLAGKSYVNSGAGITGTTYGTQA